MDNTYMPAGHAASLRLSGNHASLNEDTALRWLIIIVSSIAAIAIIQPVAGVRIIGIVLACAMVIVALVSPWLGVLALFPLAFSVATPPDGIGAKEAVFALLTVVVLSRSIVDYVLKSGVRDFLRVYALPILCGLLLLGLNFVAAVRHDVPLHDWLRGAAPFLYIFMSVPIAIVLQTNPERLKWVGIAVLAVAIVFCAYVLGYFAAHQLWEYTYYLNVGGTMVRVSKEVAAAHPLTAQGPFIERITVLVPSSTDALIPLSLAIGFVLATLAEGRRTRGFGIALMALALPTILVTYTRSMLLSALVVIAATCVYLAIYRRDRLKYAIVLLAAFSVYGIVIIEALGLQLAWLNRGELLFEALRQQGLKLVNFVVSATQSEFEALRQEGVKLVDFIVNLTHSHPAQSHPVADTAAHPPVVSAPPAVSPSLAASAPTAAPHPLAASAASHPLAAAHHHHLPAAHHLAASAPSSATAPASAVAAPHAASAATAVPPVQPTTHVVDDNVATRVDEYRVAWKMFLDHPAIGNGLGAKHAMGFVRSAGDVLHEEVGYVHNWPLYMLMAGGIPGFVAYAFLLLRPIACRYKASRLAGPAGIALRAGLGTLLVYGLFFAVVRLITFNLIIAAAWGVFLAFRKTRMSGEAGHPGDEKSIVRT